MIITKIFDTSVDLFDAQDIYSPNITAVLLKKLNERYRGKCYKSMLITDVLRVIEHSDIRIVDNRLDGAAYVDVQLEVKGIILIKGEILTDCKVIDVLNTGTIIEHRYATGLITPGTNQYLYGIIKKNQTIPIIVNDVRYNVGNTAISISGFPFSPQINKNIYYNLTGVLTDDQKNKLDYILNDIRDELKLHSENKSFEFFTELLYQFKSNQKFELSKIGSRFSLVDFNKLKDIQNGCIVYPCESQKNNNFIMLSKQELKESDGMIVNADLYPALVDILNRRLLYLFNLSTWRYNKLVLNSPDNNCGNKVFPH